MYQFFIIAYLFTFLSNQRTLPGPYWIDYDVKISEILEKNGILGNIHQAVMDETGHVSNSSDAVFQGYVV